MADLSLAGRLLETATQTILETPSYILLLASISLVGLGLVAVYLLLVLVAPKPRAPFPSEKTYLTSDPSGTPVSRQLPCWYDRWLSERQLSESTPANNGSGQPDTTAAAAAAAAADAGSIEPAEVAVTVVVPAYNEQDRILPALEDMIKYCDARFGRPSASPEPSKKRLLSPTFAKRHPFRNSPSPSPRLSPSPVASPAEASFEGYEILIVNDGSTDRTQEVVLAFAQEKGLHDVVRVINLEKNRGKGGGVAHGFRHARGAYVMFADADGASRFSDLGRLIEGCDDVVDGSNRGVAIGSRAHLVGSEAVVQRSAIRNFLMRSFHFVLMILTPPATSRIRDTQCGFKLFSREALPHIIPYMHAEGWIFDIEMLMLAESAPATPVLAADGTVIGASPGIRVAEVPIEWHEVDGSKMSLVQDSIKMAIGLTVLRASWMMGVYRRRLT